MKRFIFLTAIAIIAISASACTREKPPEPTPTAPAVRAATPAAPATTSVSVATETPAIPIPPPPVSPTLVIGAPAPIVTTTIPATGTLPTPPPIPGAPTTYTAQWGDWLSKIATKFGVTNQDILAANPGLNPNRIYPGQVLNIPAPGGSVPPPIPGATPTPFGNATAVPVPPPSGGPTTYTVQRGDWLYAIARKFGITVNQLLAANPGINQNFVYPGQVLNIPGSSPNPGPNPTPPPAPGNTYVVKPGDTLFSIAARFHTTTYALQIANRLANVHFIYPGQTLIIPSQ